jgi:hypothetical protein
MSATDAPPKPPKLVAKTAIENNEVADLCFQADEWAQFDHHFKRRLAGAADTDEISGRSTDLEIRSYFVVQRTLGEYEQ